MRRFIALSWESTDTRASAEVHRFAARLLSLGLFADVDTAGLAVFHDWPHDGPLRCQVLPGAAGVIFGGLFERRPGDCESRAPLNIDDDSARRAVATGGQHLLECYWGNFVAFLADREGHTRYVLRSVGAGVACYRLRRASVDILLSDLADLSALGIESLPVNWPYLAAFLRCTDIAVADSALQDVTEILAGECVQLSARGLQRRMLWNAASFLDHNDLESVPSAIAALRSTTQSCVEAWASVHKNILLHLSGGFDSAVVLGCLRRTRPCPRITALNRYSENPGEDERRYARVAARLSGVPLEEWCWEDADVRIRDRLAEVPMAPKPSIPALVQIEARARRELMERSRAESCWSGQGGDHLFFQFQTDLIVADFARARGLRPDLGAVVRDAARLTRKPYASLLHLAWKARVTQHARRLLPLIESDASFLTPNDPGMNLPTPHPWVDPTSVAPPGKQLQIHALIELLQRHAPFARPDQALEVHPLISQPLIELCLRIPTWMAVRGGCSRALARAAFRDVVPPVIRHRNTKGGTSTFLTSIIRKDAHFIRELLLDGVLAKQGLLNRQAIDRHLGKPQPIRPAQNLPLLGCVAAETWLRACRGARIAQ